MPRMLPLLLLSALVLSCAARPLLALEEACPGSVMAAPGDTQDPALAPLINELIGYIALNTMYDVKQTYLTPPSISFCAVGSEIAYESDRLVVDEALHAAFDLSRRHIHLVEPWSADDLFDQSILLHELLHDIQLSNREWDCTGAIELEAYLLQDKWLNEHGVRHDFNWRAILALSRCPSEDQN